MQCPRCQFENSDDNRFCEGCGHAFARACAACGRTLGPGARFCGGCGGRVNAPAAAVGLAAPQDYLPRHLADRIRAARGGAEGERKQVTVLFADIKGSLELVQGADPEEVQALLDGAIRRMMEAVHRYEGTVNKVLGDGVMALFGAPIAHEDHAVRACYAALAMQESIRRSASEVRRSHGVELMARVGINSGEVVVRGIGNDLTMDYDAIGETTHLAARMEQLAAPGTIRMTGSVLELANAFVQVRDLGPIPVRGLDRAVDAYELTGVTTLRTRFQASIARGLTEFVGRRAETELLADALRQAEQGTGRVVAVIGEPGVGKSRLFYEFIRSRATRGWLVLESGSVSYGRATSYMPVIDLLRGYFGIERGDDSRRIRERVLGKLLALDEGLRRLETPILALIDTAPEDPAWEALDASQRRRQTLDAVRSLLLRESAVQPVALVFEDLHWIDTETQAFLDSLVEGLPAAPVLLLVNYRPEYSHGWGARPYYSQRRIEALPPASATDLLLKMLGTDASLAALKRELTARTAGNPLFLEECVRALVEAGALTGAPGDYRLAAESFSLEVPATVQGVLAARIDRLPAGEKQLLQTAAVVGKDVDYGLLLAVAGLPEEALRQGLTALQAAEFVFETRLFPHPEYTFKHALTHDVTYRGILSERRRTLHRQIAEHLEREAEAGSPVQPERLAHHWSEAGIAAKAVECWRRAGRRALERSANREAVLNLERGLELLPSMPEGPERKVSELDLSIGLGVARSSVEWAGAPAVGKAFERACALSEELGDVPGAFSALWGLWRHRRTCRDFRAARTIADRLSAIAGAQSDRGLTLQASHAQWSTALYLGDWARCLEHCDDGVALYDRREHHAQVFRFGSHDPCTCGHATAALSLTMLGELSQAAVRLDEALRMAGDLDHPETLAQTLGEAVNIHLLRREIDLAVECGTMALEVMHTHEFAEYYPISCFVECWRAVSAGDVKGGLAKVREGLAARKAAGVKEEAHALVSYIDLLVTAGETEEGLSTIAELQQELKGTGVRHMDAELARLRGLLLQRLRGDGDREAEAALERAVEITRGQGARLLELRAAIDLARLRQAQGRPGDAREILSPVAGRFAGDSANSDVLQARKVLAELA